jgi:rhamnose transport system permease protein
MNRALIPAVLLVVGGILASIFSPNFMDVRYLLDSSTIYMEIGVIALAMTFVIVAGQIDLSVGSNVVLTACLAAKLLESGWGIIPTVLAACLIGTLLGTFNGVLVAKLKLPSFLVTLGTMAIYRGAAQAMMGPGSVKLPKDFTGLDQRYFLGLPWPLLLFLVAAVVAGLVLHGTVYGRWVFALGTNESASRYSGLPIDRVKVSVFALAGLMAGLGAVLIDSRLGVARHSLATGMELDVITVVVVGGTAITGGRGTVLGSVLALFLVMMIKTAMGVANVKAEYQLTTIGVLLILAVLAGRINFKLPGRAKAAPASVD